MAVNTHMLVCRSGVSPTARFALKCGFVVAVLLPAFCLSHTSVPAQDAAGPKRQRRQFAVQAAVGFLKQQQDENGMWGAGPGAQYRIGTTALCALALIESGVPMNDPAIQRALVVLRTPDTKAVYEASLQLAVLTHSKEDDDRAMLERLADLLVLAQVEDGDHRGGWTYRLHQPKPISDRSNSHYAMLGLSAAHEAGLKFEGPVFERAAQYWIQGQNADGSWSYTSRDGSGSGSMTAGGVSALLSIRKVLGTDHPASADMTAAVNRARQWLKQHDAVAQNPGSSNWLLYYHYNRARVTTLGDGDATEGSDWPQRATEFLVEKQSANGSWKGRGAFEGQPLTGTALALLALAANE